MTGMGLCGPMTAMGTVFEDKLEAEETVQIPGPSRYRGAYHVHCVIRAVLFWLLGGSA